MPVGPGRSQSGDRRSSRLMRNVMKAADISYMYRTLYMLDVETKSFTRAGDRQFTAPGYHVG